LNVTLSVLSPDTATGSAADTDTRTRNRRNIARRPRRVRTGKFSAPSVCPRATKRDSTRLQNVATTTTAAITGVNNSSSVQTDAQLKTGTDTVQSDAFLRLRKFLSLSLPFPFPPLSFLPHAGVVFYSTHSCFETPAHVGVFEQFV
jgi:hypothetical protein